MADGRKGGVEPWAKPGLTIWSDALAPDRAWPIRLHPETGWIASHRTTDRVVSMSDRPGFSIVEALVVLLVTGAALTLIFEVGVFGAQSGFRLGRRALAAADGEPGAESFRAIVRGMDFGGRPEAFDRISNGDARGWIARVNLDRPTLCADAGPFQHIQIRLKTTAEGDLLTCSADGATEPVVMMDLRPSRARFSYSDDGEHWRNRLPSGGAAQGMQRLYVRLATDDGRLDIAEEVSVPRIAEPLS